MLVHSLVILVSHFGNVIRMIRSNHYLAAHFLLRGVGVAPAFEGQTIPAMVYMIFQAMFACLTPGKNNHEPVFLSLFAHASPIQFIALAFGAAAERMSVSLMLVAKKSCT